MDIDNMFNPNGQPFSTSKPLKRMSNLEFLDSIEEIQRYKNVRSYSSYYPVKILPGVRQDKDKDCPVVIPAGTIVSVLDIKTKGEYGSADADTGINVDGEVAVTVSEIDGSVQSLGVDSFYRSENVRGLIVPANGGNDVDDSYSDEDGENGVLLANGSVADSSSDDYVRSANVPFGIVPQTVYADLRQRYLNYEVKTQGQAIHMDGFLNLPFIQVWGADGGPRTAVIDAIRSAVDDRHQYLIAVGLNKAGATLSQKDDLMPNEYGKFTVFDGGDDKQKFGKFMGIDNRLALNGLNGDIDSFPGSGVQGTDTAGLSRRMYHFIYSILSKSAVMTDSAYAKNKANIVKLLSEDLESTANAGIFIRVNLSNVIFGGAAE